MPQPSPYPGETKRRRGRRTATTTRKVRLRYGSSLSDGRHQSRHPNHDDAHELSGGILRRGGGITRSEGRPTTCFAGSRNIKRLSPMPIQNIGRAARKKKNNAPCTPLRPPVFRYHCSLTMWRKQRGGGGHALASFDVAFIPVPGKP